VDFDLRVDPSKKLELAAGGEAGQITRTVKKRIGTAWPMLDVGDEAFRRQIGPAHVAQGETRPADAELARLTGRDRREIFAKKIGGVVRQRSADRDRTIGRGHKC